jgi:GTP cyclohydrolase III
MEKAWIISLTKAIRVIRSIKVIASMRVTGAMQEIQAIRIVRVAGSHERPREAAEATGSLRSHGRPLEAKRPRNGSHGGPWKPRGA